MSTYKIDAAHSEITFKVKHLMITNVTGNFNQFDATLESEAAVGIGGSQKDSDDEGKDACPGNEAHTLVTQRDADDKEHEAGDRQEDLRRGETKIEVGERHDGTALAFTALLQQERQPPGPFGPPCAARNPG